MTRRSGALSLALALAVTSVAPISLESDDSTIDDDGSVAVATISVLPPYAIRPERPRLRA